MGEEQVLRLDVPVHDAPLVGVGEGRGRLPGEILQEGRFHWMAHQLPEGAPLHQLHGDVGRAVHLAGVVDVGDIGMVQLAGQLGFPDEGLAALVIHILQDLERHLALQTQVQCPPDLAHGPFAQAGQKAIRAEVGGFGWQRDLSRII